MIIDLETERANGLDESQLAAQVMRLMGKSEACNGPLNYSSSRCFICAAFGSQTRHVGAGNRIESIIPHPRVPKPLREVRDELIEWLISNSVNVKVRYAAKNKHVATRHSVTLHPGIGAADVYFNDVADTALALALGAVRLLGEKQDDDLR